MSLQYTLIKLEFVDEVSFSEFFLFYLSQKMFTFLFLNLIFYIINFFKTLQELFKIIINKYIISN